MRTSSVVGVGMLLLTAACSFQVSTDGGGGSGGRAKSPSVARRGPPPPPPPRNAPARAATPAAPAVARPDAPTPTHAAAVAPTTQASAPNVARIKALKVRSPKACGYQEVSPGNWVHVDCDQYKASSRSIVHLSAKKAQVLKAKKMIFRPLKTAAVQDWLKRGHQSLVKGAPATGGGGVTAATAAGGPAQIGESFPSTVDHRSESLESPIKNQGGVGSCTAHSLSAALDNAAIRAGVLKPGDRDRMASPLHVWSRYGLPDMGAAADGNIAQPVGVYTTWPQSDREACMLFMDSGSYADDCADTYGVKPGSWRSDSALMGKYNKSQSEGVYKISSIEKLAASPPNMDELQSVLATGADIWAAFVVDFPAWSNSGMKNAVIPSYTRSSGGHAVVISGYRGTPDGRQFLIHNSWGESWGEKGYAWLPEAMLTKHMYYAYKVKITNGVPKDLLTDDDCAPDELVDIGTGFCAVMCDGADERPNNGCKK